MTLSIRVVLFVSLGLAACGKSKEEAPAPVVAAVADAAVAAEPVIVIDAAAPAPEIDAAPAVEPATEIDAAAAAAPVFADPESAAVYTELQSVLAQLQERGPQHARYADDCAGVWTSVDESPLAKEKDPAAVKLVEDAAQFCLHDVALKLAKDRMAVIDTMENALEKKVNKFSPDGWDRVCGLPLETLAKAAKRYPAEADFKTLAKPIAKRCGKRPGG